MSKGKTIAAVGAPEAVVEEEWKEAYVYDPASDQWPCGLAPQRERTDKGRDDVEMPAADAAQTPGTGKGGKGGKGGKIGKTGGKVRKAPVKAVAGPAGARTSNATVHSDKAPHL